MAIRIPLFALALGAFVGVAGASAQQRQITGQVTSSATREPMAGVNVTVTGTAFAAVSNADGRYAISAPAGAVTLVFRHIAFKRREVTVAAEQTTADAALEPDVFNLEAVVVTGQATGVERRNAAIASSVVTAAELTAAPEPAVDRALAGRVPGAYIQQNSGAPGGGTQVQIRGSNTVIGSSNPLYVVDGVIYSDASISTGLFSVTASGNPQSTRNDGEKQDDPVNRLTDLNPNDVASIEILRGAAASSIYGSKGVNGVVIITTNRGKAGKPRANIIQRVGFSELVRGPGTRVFDTTTAFDQFGDTALIRSYVVNGVLPTYDHLRELAGNKPADYETQLDVSGGAGGTRYFLSGNVKGDGGIIENTAAQRQSLRANVDQTFSDRFNISLNTAFSRTTTQRGFTNNDNAGASVTYALAYIPGFVPLKPVNGVFPDPGGLSYFGANPLQTTALGTNDEAALRFTGGLTATFQAVQTARHSLKLVAAGGMDFFNQKDEVFAPPELYFEQRQTYPGTSSLANADSRFTNWNSNAIHTYTPGSGAWKTTTAVGVQWEDRYLSRSRIVARGLLPGQQNINQGAVIGPPPPFEEITHERTIALYGHEEWLGMNERLLLSGSVRAERSSANGDVGKYYFFPAAAGSYRFPQLLGQGSEAKLRFAYGETGNQPLFGQKFTSLQGGVVIGGNIGTVVGATGGDPSIQPERTREIEGGVDLTLGDGRTTAEITLWRRRTSDLLVPVTPPPSSGFSLQFINGGEIQNEGIDVAAGFTPFRTDHASWLFRTTFSSLKNKVLSLNLPGGAQGFRPANAGYGLAYGEFFVQVGQPISQIIGTDDKGNTISLGQVNPKFRWSFTNELTYHRAALSFLWEWQYGGVAQNQTLSLYDCNSLAPDAGTPAGQARTDACLNTGDARPFVQSTSFLKLRNASLSVDLPNRLANWFGATSARVSVTGVNLAHETLRDHGRPAHPGCVGRGLQLRHHQHEPADAGRPAHQPHAYEAVCGGDGPVRELARRHPGAHLAARLDGTGRGQPVGQQPAGLPGAVFRSRAGGRQLRRHAVDRPLRHHPHRQRLSAGAGGHRHAQAFDRLTGGVARHGQYAEGARLLVRDRDARPARRARGCRRTRQRSSRAVRERGQRVRIHHRLARQRASRSRPRHRGKRRLPVPPAAGIRRVRRTGDVRLVQPGPGRQGERPPGDRCHQVRRHAGELLHRGAHRARRVVPRSRARELPERGLLRLLDRLRRHAERPVRADQRAHLLRAAGQLRGRPDPVGRSKRSARPEQDRAGRRHPDRAARQYPDSRRAQVRGVHELHAAWGGELRRGRQSPDSDHQGRRADPARRRSAVVRR